jgi:flavin reductase
MKAATLLRADVRGAPGGGGLKDEFLSAMRASANSIALVTTVRAQTPLGMTVTSWCSLSTDPPSLLVCPNGSSHTATAILESGFFCANLLSDTQTHLADMFTSKASQGDRFASTEWRQLASGAPVLEGALASFDCAFTGALRPGSHHICLGEGRTVLLGTDRPLVYHDRGYGRVQMERSEGAKCGDQSLS